MKKILPICFAIIVVLFTAKSVDAQILVIDKAGKVEWNVLSDEDSIALNVPQSSSVEVKKINNENVSGSSLISLSRSGDKISLEVESGDEKKQLDVSNWKNDLVEIEQRPQTQLVKIGLTDNKFDLEQHGLLATTDLPIQVDSKSANISLTTSTGEQFLSILPNDAAQILLKANLVNRIARKDIEIVEKDHGLSYKIPGEKVFDLFGLYQYSVPLETYVSASTGEIVQINGPDWFKVVAFFLT
jgi:hypothetical protein